MKFHYFPVYEDDTMNLYDDKEIYSKISFFNKDSHCKYNKILVNAPDNMRFNIFEKICPKDKSIILGDSGGFQFMTGKLKYDTKVRNQIFSWLENNTHYAMNLDLPPVSISFEESLKRSLDNYRYFETNQSGKTKFINVVHGNSIKELDKWIDSIKDFNFDGGWAVGGLVGHPQRLYKAIMFLTLMYNKGLLDNYKEDQLLHFLGVMTFKNLIPIFYFVSKLKDVTLSFDGSSLIAISSKQMGIIYDIDYNGANVIVPSNKLKDTYFCDCEICQDKELTEYCECDMKLKGMKIYGHNHNFYLKYLEKIKNLLQYDTIVFKNIFKKFEKQFNVIDEIIKDKNNCVDILIKYSSVFIDKTISQSISVDDLF